MENGRSRAKRWCFTLNNPSEEEVAQLSAEHLARVCKAAVYGRECGETGTEHLQGYVELTDKCSLVGLKRVLPGLARAHLEIARGSPIQAAEYCRKEGRVEVDFGEFRTSANTGNALVKCKSIISGGGGFEKLYEDDETFPVAIRYEKGLRNYCDIAQASNGLRLCLEVSYYWGLPGTGKTRAVYEETGTEDVYWHSWGNWFDGYEGQKVCVFDDFSGESIGFQWLLRLLDIYPLRVPIKGGFRHWKPERIYITSNVEPFELYERPAYARSSDAVFNPLLRRIKTIKKFS